MQNSEVFGGSPIRVVVADDTRIHAQLLVDALRRDSGLEVIGSPSSTRDLIDFAKTHAIDVILLSANLDEQPLRGCRALQEIRAKNPALRAVILLDSSRREIVLQAFRAGARGILSRHESVETLLKCIRSVHMGQIWANSQQMSFAVEALASFPAVCALDANGLELLSKREMDVVRSLAEGLTNREIAARLGLSQHTIKNYLFRVFDKLGVSNRLELLFMTLTQSNGALRASIHDNTETSDGNNGDGAAKHRNKARPGSAKNQEELGRKQQGSETQARSVSIALGAER